MRSLLDGITSAMRNPQVLLQQQQQPQSPSGAPTVTQTPQTFGSCTFATEAPSDAPFSVLLLTQNIGGIDPFASGGLAEGAKEKSEEEEESPGGSASESSKFNEVPEFTRRALREFLTELRTLVHELCRRDAAAHRRSDPIALSPPTPTATLPDPPLVDLIVLHFQEIGGKRRHPAFNAFFAEALEAFLPEAGWTSGLLMESDPERFTALGSIVFLSQRMCPISSMLSFRHRTFVAVPDDPRTYGSSPTFLFHGGKFAGASRKGFLLISLRLGSVAVNFLNVHLFHDQRNTEGALGLGPSCYAERRQAALLEALAESVVVVSPEEPIFVFGDFNTRLDTAGLLQYAKESFHIDVQLAAKDVQAPENFWDLFLDAQQMESTRKFDVELQRLMDIVAQQSGVEFGEFEVRFPPTYLRLPTTHVCSAAGETEKTTTTATLAERIVATPARAYSRKRIPAWCDRVMWNPAALELMTGRRAATATDESAHRCAYQSYALAHTDHDGVALFFLGS